MIGQEHGLANELIQIINEKKNMNVRLGVDVHSVWCIGHRLNLLAQDLTEVENINFVIMFIRWFTANDRLVSYTAFARRNQETKKKRFRHSQKHDGCS